MIFVSLLIPTLNEEEHILNLIESLASQTHTGPYEVLILDGGSTDRTRELVQDASREYPWLRLVHNPGRTQAHAFNLGLVESRGDVVGYVGAHSELAPDYIEQTVKALEESGAAGVGGRWDVVPGNAASEAIAIAMNSPFGVGTAHYRYGKEPRFSDTVLYGSYRRGPLEEVGGIDTSLKINEDYELNYRLRAAGHRLYYSPAIRITYYSRSTLLKLWRQYFSYGFWKARVIKQHPRSVQSRHLVAPLFVAGLVAGLPLMLLVPALRWPYIAGIVLYACGSVAASGWLASRSRWRYLLTLPLVFFTLHLAWGSGFWAGVWHWWVRRAA